MQYTGDILNYDILAAQEHTKEIQITITSGSTFITIPMGEIYSCRVSRSLFNNNAPTIGSCCSAELDLTIKKPNIAIPYNASVVVEVRLKNAELASEWLPVGVYRIDTRSETSYPEVDNTLTLHCYDPMLSTSEVKSTIISQSAYSFLTEELPVVLPYLASEEFLSSYATKLSSIFIDTYGKTFREILSYIGMKLCGNFVFEMLYDRNNWRHIGLNFKSLSGFSGTENLGQNVMTFDNSPRSAFFRKCIIHTPSEDIEYTSPSFVTGDSTIEITSDWDIMRSLGIKAFTIRDAEFIATQMSYVPYTPFSATGALVNPALQLNDRVLINGKEYIVYEYNTDYDSLCACSIGAPSGGEILHEFKYVAKEQRQFNNKVSRGAKYSGVKIGDKDGFVGTCGNASVVVRDDNIAFQIGGRNAIYYDQISNKFIINTSYVTII